MSGTYYRPGENRSCCPVCGKEYRASEYRKRWDGLWVCWKDYEERHPQDFVRGRKDDMRPAVVAGCCGSDGNPELAVSEAPLCPVLQEPLPGETVDGFTSVNLVFSTYIGVTSYRVYLWEDGDPQPTSPTYTVTGSPLFVTGLTEDTTYRWFVSAVLEGMERDCSGNVRTFTTPLAVPACPSLTSPADGAEIEAEDLDPVDVTLTWSASSGATSYKVYLAIDGGPLLLQGSTASTSFQLDDLAIGSDYVWLVRAVNAAGESSGCGSREFSILPPAQIVTIYDEPGEYEYPGPNPFAVSVTVRVLGAAGGGAGGAVENGSGGLTGGAGGGGGAGREETFDPSELTGPIPVSVGAGGVGGVGGTAAGDNNGTDGSAGQASSFGDIVAGGGGGGYRGQSSGSPGRVSGGGGGGGEPNSGGTGTGVAGGAGGTTGGGAGGFAGAGASASTDSGGSGGGRGSASAGTSGGATSLLGGVGGGGGGAGVNGVSLQPGANGTLSAPMALNDVPQGGAVVSVGPVFGHGEPGENPSDPLELAGSSGAGGGGSPSAVDGFNTGRGGNGGNGGRGSGGGGGGSAFSSLGSGGAGGTGGNGYVVIIETNG